jgi:hypothetical protein
VSRLGFLSLDPNLLAEIVERIEYPGLVIKAT